MGTPQDAFDQRDMLADVMHKIPHSDEVDEIIFTPTAVCFTWRDGRFRVMNNRQVFEMQDMFWRKSNAAVLLENLLHTP